MIAWALTRKAPAVVRAPALVRTATSAKETFQKTLTKHRNPDTLKKLTNDAKKAKKEHEQQEYFNSQMADKEHEKGNQQKYPEAVKHYKRAAIKRNRKESNSNETYVEILESKRRIVFALDKRDAKDLDESVEFYVFDERFTPILKEGKKAPKDRYLTLKVEDPNQIAQPLSKLNHSHDGASYISLGHQVYRVGGSYSRCNKCWMPWDNRSFCPPHREVDVNHIFSTSTDCWDFNTNSWTPFHKMNLGRRRAHLHLLGGKLYAIGGFACRKPGDALFMEVLDENGWSAISLPDAETMKMMDCCCFVSATLEHKGCILLGFRSSESFYCYTPPHSWTRYKLSYNSMVLDGCLQLPAVVVGNHLLWLDDGMGTKLYGLDIVSDKYFCISLAEEGLLPSADCHHYRSKLVHVEGNRFSLVWCDNDFHLLLGNDDPIPPESELMSENFGGYHCSNFTINFEKAYESTDGCITVLSHQKCIGPSQFHHFLDAAFIADVTLSNVRERRKKKKNPQEEDELISETSII